MKIQALRKYRGRNPNGMFQDLPPQLRMAAWHWLGKLKAQRKAKGLNTPRWVYAILVGQAKRLAKTSAEERSAWGRSMLAKRGGYAVQRKFRQEDRNIQAYATRCRVQKQAAVKRARQPGSRRGWSGNLDGI